MIFFKPIWVTHEDNKPIFSIDIHPNGNRFATGGQGESGGKIVIWNVAPLITEDAEMDPKVPKVLCQMDNHLACVNIVRWSNEGHLLASGGDDKLVMIWRLTNEGTSTVFGSGKINTETWKCIYTLNSHQGDVLDLSWAPHDGWLASGSVDNTVIIWNAAKFPEKVAVLKEHTGMVKGITWDPVGKYLASQSDDKSVRVWRTGEWKEEAVVTDPFVDCSGTTHVLRLSWSPDGQYLVTAHAMNGGGSTAQIIERDGWRFDKDFVGHRKAVTCVRFSNSIFNKTGDTKYCCCAVGSRDRAVSVWLTSLKRPLVVVKDLFKDSVLDISWSSNRPLLLACSWDGTVACFIFDETEIGTPLSNSEKNSLYEKLYHKSSWNLGFTGTQIAETPELLTSIEEVHGTAKTKTFPKDSAVPAPKTVNPVPVEAEPEVLKMIPNTTVFVPQNKQLETRLPSGKRRITPMLLTPSVPSNATRDSELTIEIPMNETGTFSSSSPKKSKIVVETVKEFPKPQITKPSALQQNSQMVLQAPGSQIKQLFCCEVPGDEPITQVINILDSHKIPLGPAVLKNALNQKVQITNKCHKTSKGFLSKIETFKTLKDKVNMWETFLGSVIRCAAVNRKMIVACCEDSSVNTYDIKSGARVLPALLLEDSASALCFSPDSYCLVLTKTGLVHMWNFSDRKCVLSRVSVRSLLTNKVSVSGLTLSPNNVPVITLTDGRAYSYLVDLQTWVVVSNPSDPLCYAGNSLYRTLPSNLPLTSLQKHMPSHNSNDTFPPGVTLSFLESQVASSKMLDSTIEYKHWLMNLVNHVLEKGPEIRLRCILDKLMMECSSKSSSEKVQKKALLTEIMNVIKSKLVWQRVHKEYNEQILKLE